VTIRDTDKGFRALVDSFKANPKTTITVGIHAREGAAAHKGSKFGETVADVATLQEFGADGIPQRSFLRAWFDENQAQTAEATKRMLQSVMQGKRTKQAALELLGQAFVGQIQKRIAQGIAPPNSPDTIARKGSSTPLIDTGQMRSAITYAVEVKS
jgi:hypothetical protein